MKRRGLDPWIRKLTATNNAPELGHIIGSVERERPRVQERGIAATSHVLAAQRLNFRFRSFFPLLFLASGFFFLHIVANDGLEGAERKCRALLAAGCYGDRAQGHRISP